MKITRSNIESMQKRFRATFINSISGYKSLNLVGTRSVKGVSNLAPFNSIIHIGSNPPLIGMIVRPQTEEHQTLQNIKDTFYYTLNHVQESFVEKAHQSSAKYI
jgi:flavin reductase (DIM6/NTAB) family NADH-FMN oxidoreductase RutF